MTNEELPPDPFADNPLMRLDMQALEVLEQGVEYFEFFPNLFYGHVYEYAKMHIDAIVDEGVLDLPSREDRQAIATVLVHGLMIGALSQQDEGFLQELLDNI